VICLADFRHVVENLVATVTHELSGPVTCDPREPVHRVMDLLARHDRGVERLERLTGGPLHVVARKP
jgi:hypothetical protein